MLSKKTISTVILIIVSNISMLAQEQKTIGIFFHGFQGSSEKWTEVSRVPQEWKNDGILNDFIALNYETMELQQQNVPALLGKLQQEIAQFANQKGYSLTSDRWVLIGHSLGGLVARSIYPSFKSGINLNMVAVVSVGGPMQGAGAADITSSIVDTKLGAVESKIRTAYRHKIKLINFAVGFLPEDQKNQVRAIPDYIAAVRDSALGYVSHIERENAGGIIGREGDLIKTINRYRETDARYHPPQFLSLIGSEKSMAPVRMAGQIFDGDERLKDEVKMIGNFNKLKTDYFYLHAILYNAEYTLEYRANRNCRMAFPLDLLNICQPIEDAFKRARRYRDEWAAASRELDNMDATWAELIDSKRYETFYERIYLPECERTDARQIFDTVFDTPNCSSDPGGEYIYTPYTVGYPTKNDGVITIESGLWSKNDSFGDLNNQYFSDVPADGGYNHFELRNHARAYTLPGHFEKGDPNPSMGFAAEWLIDRFGRVNN